MNEIGHLMSKLKRGLFIATTVLKDGKYSADYDQTRLEYFEFTTYLKIKIMEVHLNGNDKMLSRIRSIFKSEMDNNSEGIPEMECTIMDNGFTIGQLYIDQEYIDFSIQIKRSVCKTIIEYIDGICGKASTKSNKPKGKDYSLKAVAIAFYLMGKPVDETTAHQLLSDHTVHKSVDKLLSKKIYRTSDLINLKGNKRANTVHLNDMRSAKRLISSFKNEQAEAAIDNYIAEFVKAQLDN